MPVVTPECANRKAEKRWLQREKAAKRARLTEVEPLEAQPSSSSGSPWVLPLPPTPPPARLLRHAPSSAPQLPSMPSLACASAPAAATRVKLLPTSKAKPATAVEAAPQPKQVPAPRALPRRVVCTSYARDRTEVALDRSWSAVGFKDAQFWQLKNHDGHNPAIQWRLL